MNLNFVIIKLSKVLILLLPLAVLGIAAFSCVPASSGGGCAGPGAQGWSGLTGYNGILYFGSMDGKVLALDPSARSRGLSFPSEMEWSYTIKAPVPPGSICGPACAPAAPGVKIYGTLAAAEELVYVGTYNGKVMAMNRSAPGYDEEGNPSWIEKGEWFYPRGETKFIGAIVGSPVVAGDAVYVGDSEGTIYALDAVSGNKRWEFETGGRIWTSPAVSDGVVYVGNYDGSLYALSSRDGSQLWKFESPAAIASSPVVSGDNVFLGTFDRYLYAIGSADGEERWRFEGENWFWASSLVKDNVVYAGCLDHKIYALEVRTGKELWQFVTDSPIVSTPVLVDNLLVVVSQSGETYILEADSGALERTVSIGYSVMAPLYAGGNMVYIHARDRYVYAIDVQNGEIAWRFSSDIE